MAFSRSVPVQELVTYLVTVEGSLKKSPLLDRLGLRLDDLRIPLRVVPHQAEHDMGEDQARQETLHRWAFRGDSAEDPIPEALRDPDQTFIGCGGNLSSRWFSSMVFGQDLEELTESEISQPRSPLPTDNLDELEEGLYRAVLLGDPGSGKTEWLKRLARSTSEKTRRELEGGGGASLDSACVPLFVRLPDMARVLADEEALTTLVRACDLIGPGGITDAQALAASIVGALVRAGGLPNDLGPWLLTCLLRDRTFGTGPNVLLALDGWDEVRSGAPQLARCLEAYSRTATARILLSSRPVGYPGDLLSAGPADLSGCRELRLRPFRLRESIRFVHRYFASNPERGYRMVAKLRDNPAVAGLGQNPLLVTLLCAAFSPAPDQPPLRFPVRQGELYDRVLLGLLGKWRDLRERGAAARGQAPTSGPGPMTQQNPRRIRAKLRFLEELALHFFPSEILSGERIDAFLEEWLARRRPTDPLLELQGRGIDLLSELCEDGVLTIYSGGASPDYAFLHLAFQEALAARALGRQVEEKHEPGLIDAVACKAWDPHWQYVVILLAERLRVPEALIERLADPVTDDHFRHRLAVAAQALGEIEPKQLTTPMSSLRDRIGLAVFREWHRHLRQGTYDLADHLQPALAVLSQIGARVGRLSMATLVQRMLVVPKPLVAKRAARTLTAMGSGLAPSLELCCGLLDAWRRWSQNRDTWSVEGELAKALAAMREQLAGRSDIIRFLVREFRSEEVTSVRVHLLRFLGAVAEGTGLEREIGQALLDALGDTESWVRKEAARALATARDEVVPPALLVPALVPLLEDPESDVRSPAAFALGKRETNVIEDPAAIVALGKLAGRSAYVNSEVGTVYGRDARAARDALRRVRNVVERNPEVLADLLETRQDADCRRVAIEALAALGEAVLSNSETVAVLVQALEDDDLQVVESAVQALRRLGPKIFAEERVATGLLKMLSHPEPRIRAAAIEVLGKTEKATIQRLPGVVPALLESLRDEGRWVRAAAADSLGELASALPDGGQIAQELADHVHELGVWSTLGQMSGEERLAPYVLPAILNGMRDPVLAEHGADSAVARLGIAAARNLEVLAALLETYARPPIPTRPADPEEQGFSFYLYHVSLALKTLSWAPNPHPELVPFLTTILVNEDRELRGPAAYALLNLPDAALSDHASLVVAGLVEVLNDEVSSMPLAAAQGLARLADVAVEDPRAVLGLVRSITHWSIETRRESVKALWRMGPEIVQHPGLVTALVEILSNADGSVALGAAQLLHRIGQPAARHSGAIPTLLRRALRRMEPPVEDGEIARSDYGVPEWAGKALAAIGPEVVRHPTFAKEIVAALDDRQWDAFRLLETLGLLVLDSPDVVAAALDASERRDLLPDFWVISCLVTAGRLGLAVGEQGRVLKILRRTEAGTRAVVVGSLGEQVGRDPEILAALVETLGHPERSARESAARTLIELQRQPPNLRIFREDAGYRVREIRELSYGALDSPVEVPLRHKSKRKRPTPRQVDVGILVAIPEEFRVLYPQLPSPKAKQDTKSGSTDYLFDWPREQGGPYRCAATLVGSMGPENAAVATDGFLDRRKPRTLVLLGIAAGLDADVRLGDVVVAQEVNMYLHRAKFIPGKGDGFWISPGGDSYRCSAELVRMVQHFEFAQAQDFRAWQDAASTDLKAALGSAQVEELVRKGWVRERPKAVAGLVASGPVVVAAESFVRLLKGMNRNYLALEMEAGGVLAAVYSRADSSRSLVLRGISDFGDERKKHMDQVASGELRRQAMRNVVDLLWRILSAGSLPSAAG